MSEAEELVAGLSALQEEGLLCDVELEAENQTIPAHRVVLAAASTYFRAMFCGNFQEKKSQIVTIEEVTFIGLKAVVDSIYKNSIKLTTKNLPDILSAAHLMQMTKIVDKCKEWMLQNMRTTNCLTLLKYSEKYNLQTVENAANDFVLCNFFDVSKTASFYEISYASLCRYLSSNLLHTDFKEEEVFKIAKTWIRRNHVVDDGAIFGIIKNIRFALISPTMLSTEIMYDDIIQKIPDCHKLVVEAMTYHMNVFTQPLYTGNLNKPRGKTGLLIIPNGARGDGFNIQGSGEDVYCVSLSDPIKTRTLSNVAIPIVWESMCCITKNSFIYLFGVTSSEYYQNFTKRYDSATDSWVDLKSIPRRPAVGVSIASVGENIYVIGGCEVDYHSRYIIADVISEMYVYSIPKNTWSISDPLPLKSGYSNSCSYLENVYVTGGHCSTETTRNLYIYDTKAKLWLTKKPMNRARCHHVMEVVDDKLYVLGGRSVSIGAPSMPENSAEMYDPQSNQWTMLLDNQCIPTGASSFVINQKIYFAGGSRFNLISQFNIDKRGIILLKAKLPANSTRNACALMTLPKLL